MKKIILSLMGLFVVISALSIVSATPQTWKSIDLVQKDPSDWSVVDGATGKITMNDQLTTRWFPCYKYNGRTVSCIKTIWLGFVSGSAVNLEPKTKYTLVYYGDSENNDVWNHVTCIKTAKTNNKGKVTFGKTKFDRIHEFFTDDLEQKFWIVPSEDLDCKNNVFLDWNPENYLFEQKTI